MATANDLNLPGGSLFDFAGVGAATPPYQNLGYTGGSEPNALVKGLGMGDPVFKKVFGGLFGDDKKPRTPAWQRLANREWAQGNAVLSAYARLYEPTLAINRRQAADYGDLYRKAANETLAHNVTTNRTIREADLADYMRLGPQLLAARREADPLFSQSYDLAAADLRDVNAPLPANVQRDITEAVRGSQVRRGMGLGGSDAFEEALTLAMSGEDFRNNRRDRAFRQAGSLLSQYGDPFQSLTGRTASPGPQGANIMAPKAGADFDDLFSYGVSREVQSRNIDAAESASNKALAGQIIGGLLGAAGGFAGACWVAREIFGALDPRWLQFREWMLRLAPEPLWNWYLHHGEAFAEKLKTQPHRKPRIQAWMESKIAELQGA